MEKAKIQNNKIQEYKFKETNKDEYEINLLSEKLKEEKQNNKNLKATNNQLLQDIIILKNNIKSLIPCFPKNWLYPFPPFDELIAHILNFINVDSYKLYLHLLNKNQFPKEIILIHFKEIFIGCYELILNHFSNVENILIQKFENIEIIKSLNYILKNAYQVNWKYIYNKLINENNLGVIINDIKNNLYEKAKQYSNFNIGFSSSFINYLKEYIKSTIEVFIKCYICQPQVNVDLTKIGKILKFNSVTNECFPEENIERGNEVYILIPSFYYIEKNYKKSEVVNKNIIIENINKMNNNESTSFPMYKNKSKINLNNSKSKNLFINNNEIKSDKHSFNNKINFREKENCQNKHYDRKKYSEIYINSKSYANRNVNFYNFSTNNQSIQNNYNVKKIRYNRINKRSKKYYYKNIEENKKKKENIYIQTMKKKMINNTN